MKYPARFAIALLVGWIGAAGLSAGPGAGGGHGGGGGHSGGHGGFSSGGGHSVGHAVGHSFGHFFGGHSKNSGSGPDTDPFRSVGVGHGKGARPAASWMAAANSRRFHHHHFFDDFPFGDRFPFFPRTGFGFAGCDTFGFPHRGLFFGNDFNCFGGGFLFDPFFLNGFSDSFIGPRDQDNSAAPEDSMTAMEAEEDADAAEESASTYLGGTVASEETSASIEETSEEKSDELVALLQLRDGSMYGLTEYWVQDGQLHYRTTYGGENTIPLDRIDMAKTQQLNAERGTPFQLDRQKP